MPFSTSGSSPGSREALPFSIRSGAVEHGRRRIVVRGELDIATSPRLNEALLRELLAGQDVELDLTTVPFMDASALGTILGARNRFERRKHSLLIRLRASSQPHRLLKVSGILPVLTLTLVDTGRPGPQR
jgi:anti-anti-sigma factor